LTAERRSALDPPTYAIVKLSFRFVIIASNQPAAQDGLARWTYPEMGGYALCEGGDIRKKRVVGKKRCKEKKERQTS
jgi:hypothetical protein